MSQDGYHHFVAVANDNLDIIIFQIEYREPPYPVDLAYTAKHMCTIRISELTELLLPTLDDILDDIIARSNFASHLAWSPWHRDGNGTVRSILAFLFDRRINVCQISFSLRDDELKMEAGPVVLLRELPITTTLTGPLAFNPTLDGETATLIVNTSKDVFSFTITLNDASKRKESHADRDSWTEVSAMVFWSSDGKERLINAPFTGALTISEYVDFELPDLIPIPERNGDWRSTIATRQAMYGVTSHLEVDIATYIWGAAKSPIDNMFLLLTAYVGTNSPEYYTEVDGVSQLHVMPFNKQKLREDPMPTLAHLEAPEKLNSDLTALTFQHWKISLERNTNDIRNVLSVMNMLSEQYAEAENHTVSYENYNSFSKFATHLNGVMRAPFTKMYQLRILAEIFLLNPEDIEIDTESSPILRHITHFLASIPLHEVRDKRTRRMVIAHKIVAKKYDFIAEDDEMIEKCPWDGCDGDIKYCLPGELETCTSCGMPFDRCGISLRPITQFEHLKTCGLCEISVLDEISFLDDDDEIVAKKAPDPKSADTTAGAERNPVTVSDERDPTTDADQEAEGQESNKEMEEINPTPELPVITPVGKVPGFGAFKKPRPKAPDPAAIGQAQDQGIKLWNMEKTLAYRIHATCNTCVFCGGRYKLV